jgi:hypothetical protein
MRKSPTPSRKGQIRLEHDLIFPESRDFRSKASPVPLADITRLSEERLPLMNSAPDFEQIRLAMKAKKMFVL